jgi:signal peptidase I
VVPSAAGDADEPGSATTGRRRVADPAKEKRGSFWRELPVLVVIALVLALLIKTFLVQAFYIPSGSMEPTLQVGDRVLVNRLVYRFSEPKRGDVVVFNGVDSWTPEVTVAEPANPVVRGLRDVAGLFGFASPSEKDFVKRVVGVPGDHVRCCDAKGRITVNGVPLDEPYLYPGNPPSQQRFDVVVPEGRLWVMGDHRSESSDSRFHLGDPGGGTIPIDHVVGKAFAVVWPLDHLSWLSTPKTYDNPALDSSS